uniref:Uncharacterized protein n=1 Tax=Arundo donax TaxID=35708 RepID=A0A0A8ZH14_ARUDO
MVYCNTYITPYHQWHIFRNTGQVDTLQGHKTSLCFYFFYRNQSLFFKPEDRVRVLLSA